MFPHATEQKTVFTTKRILQIKKYFLREQMADNENIVLKGCLYCKQPDQARLHARRTRQARWATVISGVFG